MHEKVRFFILQVIWATGISMLVLAAVIYMNRWLIFITGLALIAGHNLLDKIHVQGNGPASFFWSLLHEPGDYTFGRVAFSVRYPVLPWIGIMATGYCAGKLYTAGYDAGKRKKYCFSPALRQYCFSLSCAQVISTEMRRTGHCKKTRSSVYAHFQMSVSTLHRCCIC